MQTANRNLKGYELEERIGTGGFGVVHRAHQPTVGREVAIKIILPHFANHPEFIRRFETEAHMVARLEHPFIVPLYDYWRDPEGAYLVMRYLRGGSLRDALVTGEFDLETVASVMDQVTSALNLAHRNGVIHRDLKPGNILLDEDGFAYLADFGIAKNLDSGNEGSVTSPDSLIGSPDYLAPEQARSEPVTPQTDIYSLGVVLYEMLVGEHPFPNMSAVERIYKHLNEPLPPIKNLSPDLAEAVNEIVQKATSKNPVHRFADVLEMAAAFRDAAAVDSSGSGESILELLTRREHDILQLIIKGLSNKEIAQELYVAVSTVKWYIRQIYKKLRVRNRTQAIVRARELNLISGDIPDDYQESVDGVTFIPQPVLNNPYKGLRAFQVADTHDFFGREKLTRRLVTRMNEAAKSERFLAVVGPSGSGKSSLIKAGLIPALLRGDLPGSDRWYITDMMPGSRPLDELEMALTRVIKDNSIDLHEHLSRDENGLLRIAGTTLTEDDSELVIVIDQFEELFTLVENEDTRIHFLKLIHATVTDPRSQVRIVVTLRADFYDRPLHYPEFGELMRNRIETVLPLTVEELQRAIIKPAEQVGVGFETGLVARIVDDVLYQPGALPLLQYALTELFELCENRTLTMEAYQSIGGTVGALASRADNLYAEYDEKGQETIRQMFLRLVTPGEGTEDTRRRVPHTELIAVSNDDEDLMDDIINTFAEYRLLALDHDPRSRLPTVEVAHEAILHEWDRLRGWLDESQDDIMTHRQLATLAADWHENGRANDYLVRGARLEQLQLWAWETRLALTSDEMEFLEASTREAERQQQLRQQQQERETLLERRSRSVLKALVAVFLVAAVISGALAVFAFGEQASAQEERETAEIARDSARQQRDEARSLVFAADARTALEEGDTDFALTLIANAMRLNPTSEVVRRTLVEVASFGGAQKRLEGHVARVTDVEYTPDGSHAVSIALDGEVIVWDLQTAAPLHRLAPPERTIAAGNVTVTPDGKLALVEWFKPSNLSVVGIVDVESGELIGDVNTRTWIWCLAISPDSSRVLIGFNDGVISEWDMATGEEIRVIGRQFPHGITTLAYGSESNIILSTTFESASIWDAETGDELAFYDQYTYPARLSIDERSVFSTLASGSLVQWDIESGDLIQEFRRDDYAIAPYSIAVSPDGKTVASAYDDGLVILWDIASGNKIWQLIGNRGGTEDINFSPDGLTLLSGSGLDDNNIRLWDLTNILNMQVFNGIGELSPDGSMLLLAPSRLSETTRKAWIDVPLNPLVVMDAASGEILYQLTLPENSMYVSSAFSPNGQYLAVNAFDRQEQDSYVLLWTLNDGQLINRFESLYYGYVYPMLSLDFSSDSQLIAGGVDIPFYTSWSELFVWDINTGRVRHSRELIQTIFDIAFLPDGRIIAVSEQEDIGAEEVLVINPRNPGDNFTLSGHSGNANALAIDPHGQHALTGSDDGTLIIWDLDSRDSRQLTWKNTGIGAVALTDDSVLALAGNDDGNVSLWNLETGEIIHRFIGHTAPILSVGFTNDRVFSTSADGVTRFWAPPPYRTVDEIMPWLHATHNIREFTCEEKVYYDLESSCEDNDDPAGYINYPTLTPSVAPELITPTVTMTPYPSTTPITPTATITPIPPLLFGEGSVEASEDEWTFEIGEAQSVSIVFDKPGARTFAALEFTLLAPDGSEVAQGEASPDGHWLELPASGTYTLIVKSRTRFGSYTVTIK